MFLRQYSNQFVSFFLGAIAALVFSHQAMANEMVLIPAGKFIYGEKNESIALKDYYIQKTEVTWETYKKVVKDAYFEKGQEKHPAAEVSYFDAETYCKAIGARIPTMKEWVKAARGTDGRTYPWGNEFQAGAANTNELEKNGTVPVGSFEKGKSPYGLYDMAGNVWEWVDSWDESKRYRFMMGGSYFENDRQNTTISQLSSIPDDMHLYLGFRCAKDK